MRFHTVEIRDSPISTMSEHTVIISGTIRKDGRCSTDRFGDHILTPLRCPHDLSDQVVIRMTSDQWVHVASKSSLFIVVQAPLVDGYLDTTQDGAGVLASPDARISGSDGSPIKSFELCSGGFSGWTHVIRRLQELGHEFHHKIAVDFDRNCAEMYTKSHGFDHVMGPQNFDWGNDQIAPHVFVIPTFASTGGVICSPMKALIWLRSVLHALLGA